MSRFTILAAAAATVLAGAVQAQTRPPSDEPFTIQGDQLPPPSHDAPHYRQYDPRYSQTYHQQMAEPQKPGGGCLRYGAVGAAGGYVAGHPVLGAIAGCVAGRVVRHRDRERIEQEQQQGR